MPLPSTPKKSTLSDKTQYSYKTKYWLDLENAVIAFNIKEKEKEKEKNQSYDECIDPCRDWSGFQSK